MARDKETIIIKLVEKSLSSITYPLLKEDRRKNRFSWSSDTKKRVYDDIIINYKNKLIKGGI